MTQEQQRLEVQSATIAFVNQLVYQQGVSASMVEDALNKALVAIKDMTVQEFINAVSAETAIAAKAQEDKEEGSGE